MPKEKIVLVKQSPVLFSPHITYARALGGRGEGVLFPCNNLDLAPETMPPGTAINIYDTLPPHHNDPSRPSTFLGRTYLTDSRGISQEYVIFSHHLGNGEILLTPRSGFLSIWNHHIPITINKSPVFQKNAREQLQLVQAFIRQCPPLPFHPPDQTAASPPQNVLENVAAAESLARWCTYSSHNPNDPWSKAWTIIPEDCRFWVARIDHTVPGQIHFLPAQQ